MPFELAANALIACALLLYAAGWGTWVARRVRAGAILAAAGWFCTLALTLLNGAVVQGPPLGNMYQVIVVLALTFGPLALWLARRDRLAWTTPYFIVLSTLPLTGALFMEKDALWRRMPALQSHWFIPHVLAYMIAYALALIAIVLLAAKRIRQQRELDSSQHDHAIESILRLAFPFMTFGMLSGALWAERAWGQYWSWDPKETWSLIMWMLYLIYLHARTEPSFRRHADLAHLLGFIALLITFFLVNLLPRLASVLHGYA